MPAVESLPEALDSGLSYTTNRRRGSFLLGGQVQSSRRSRWRVSGFVSFCLNLRSVAEEAVQTSDFAERMFQVCTNSGTHKAHEQSVVGIDVSANSLVDGVACGATADHPLRVK